MSDTSSTDTDQNEVVFTTKINGTEKAVTRAQAIRYAQQVGSMAEQAAALAKRQEDLDQWDRFVTGYERDPHGTMAQLATAAGGQYNPRGSAKGAAQPDEDEDDSPNAALMAEIQALKAQVSQVTGDLSGYQVKNSIEKEIADLKGANPKMTDDEFREVITKASTYGGLPLKEAHRLVKMEAIENGRNLDSQADHDDRSKLPITAGAGTPASRVGGNGSIDYSKPLRDVLKDSWQLTAAKTGISPD